MEIDLIDGSRLYVRETLLGGMKRKYAYHWQDAEGRLLIRWDNAPDWDIESFPHHKHVGEQDEGGSILRASSGPGSGCCAQEDFVVFKE